MPKLDEYGERRITAKEWGVIHDQANAVIRHHNRHVMAFSLRAVRQISAYQCGIYFDVSTERAKKMALIGHQLLIRNSEVAARFPDLVHVAAHLTRMAMKKRESS